MIRNKTRTLKMLFAISLLSIVGYVVYTCYLRLLPFSGTLAFDPNRDQKLIIVDAITNMGVSNVPVYLGNNQFCKIMIRSFNNETLWNLCRNLVNGKTDSTGVYIIKNPSSPVSGFQLGNRPGYNTNIGVGSFFWEDGFRKEVVYKIIPLKNSASSTINQESIINTIEKDQNFQWWKSAMDKVMTPNIDVRNGNWRVYYGGTKDNAGDWMIVFYIDSKTGKIISYEEPMRKILPILVTPTNK